MAPASTKRGREISQILRELVPLIPWADAEPVRTAAGQKRYGAFPPKISVWLCLVAYIRHAHTDYDRLLGEGMDPDGARYMVRDDINDQLARWGASRRVSLQEQ